MDSEDYSSTYYPEEATTGKNLSSMIEILSSSSALLNTLRHEFRGEELVQTDNGENIWFQTTKPLFVRTNIKTEEPLKQKVKTPRGEEVYVYVPHEEAIEEIISLLKMCGVNEITPMGTTDDKEINLDLFEFERELSKLLTLNRKNWGIEKNLRPFIYKKIKQIVQDARTMQLNGRTLKAFTQIVKRIESVPIGDRKEKTPYE